jgi:very-short-patch-repair endonuclease
MGIFNRYSSMNRENYEQVRNHARQMRATMTPAEESLWQVIRMRRCGGHRFLRQRIVGRYILDFYCAESKLAIEVDGEIHLRPDVARYDSEREKTIREECGIRFLRISNEEVLSSSKFHLHLRVIEALNL